jgi:hypothetical protein
MAINWHLAIGNEAMRNNDDGGIYLKAEAARASA